MKAILLLMASSVCHAFKKEDIPTGCRSFFDGCNNCMVPHPDKIDNMI